MLRADHRLWCWLGIGGPYALTSTSLLRQWQAQRYSRCIHYRMSCSILRPSENAVAQDVHRSLRPCYYRASVASPGAGSGPSRFRAR
eukprot:4505623-Prymnesium_polylepis.3